MLLARENFDEYNDWSEDEVEMLADVIDTMLTATDFVGDREHECVVSITPCEGNIPMIVVRNKYAEELAYPGIFLGDNDKRITPVHDSEISKSCKSELRRYHHRCAICVENILFKTKKLQMKILHGNAKTALRKCHTNKRSITAGQLKQQAGAIEKLIHHYEDFKLLRVLKGTISYFEKSQEGQDSGFKIFLLCTI